MILFLFMLNKIIFGGIIIVIVIITTIGLSVVFDNPEKLDINNQSTSQESYVPKKITLELSDGVNLGERSGP